ncbi:glycosyltransferase family 2 protein [Pelagicoccus albus]|uniref:Glycosyltransferase family 2 protein n=1 Tax=Pelagicoccus albus TaxID=415222 RepID=A0A7X1B7Z6_9BACT|nr:glycosyltransferase family 2 protein [Pelagicoccus albus]MBC2607232.1 glycosyltransferase family 2 protein [Pelagicoccus albus]
MPTYLGHCRGLVDKAADYGFGEEMIEEKLKRSPCVSVVVLDFNGSAYWSALCSALSRQSYRDFEVVVVVNGEPLPDVAESEGLDLLILSPGENLGFAGGANLAWSAASGEFVAFLNNDALPEKDWLQHLVNSIETSNDVGAVASKVLFQNRYGALNVESSTFVPSSIEESSDDRELGIRVKLSSKSVSLFTACGTYGPEYENDEVWTWTSRSSVLDVPEDENGIIALEFSYHPSLVGTVCRLKWGESEPIRVVLTSELHKKYEFNANGVGARYLVNNAGSEIEKDWHVTERGIYQSDSLKFDHSIDLEVASACSLLVRKSALSRELPFDEGYFAYYEDVDLSRTLRRSGYKILYQPQSRVYHARSATAGTQSPFQVYHATRNRLWMIASHAPWKVVWRVASHDLLRLDEYSNFLDAEFSTPRLKLDSWVGFISRIWRRLCDAD